MERDRRLCSLGRHALEAVVFAPSFKAPPRLPVEGFESRPKGDAALGLTKQRTGRGSAGLPGRSCQRRSCESAQTKDIRL